MMNDFPPSYMDALLAFAFDIPPIALNSSPIIKANAIHIVGPGRPPEVEIGAHRHPVIGITASGWLFIVGIGWQLCECDNPMFDRLIKACNAMHRCLIKDRPAYHAAHHRYIALPETGFIGGLREFSSSNGRHVVCIDNIISADIKAALAAHIENSTRGPKGKRINHQPPLWPPKGQIDSNIWWAFAWRCKTTPKLAPALSAANRDI